MRLGLVLPLVGEDVAGIPQLAQAAEAHGFESMWLGEHTHMPTETVHTYTRGKSAAGTRDGFLPDYYRRFPDPYIALTAAAAVTTTLRIGTAVALPAEHQPLALAKAIATLDQVSGGRFVFGAGFGWNPLELANNGVRFEQRRQVFREKLLAMKSLWTEDKCSFDGEHVQFTESWSWPKPVQRPHPPILVGAKLTARTIDLIAEVADGCIPVQAFEHDRLAHDVQLLRVAFEKAGRDPASLDVTVVDPAGGFAGKRSPEAFDATLPSAKMVDALEAAGVTRFVVALPLSSPELTSYALGRYAAMPFARP